MNPRWQKIDGYRMSTTSATYIYDPNPGDFDITDLTMTMLEKRMKYASVNGKTLQACAR